MKCAYKRPAVVYDTDYYVMLKIGEYEDMEKYYKLFRKQASKIDYRKLNMKLSEVGLPKLSKPLEKSLELIELPPDQNIIHKIIHNSGYLKNYIDELDKNFIKVDFEPI